MNRRSVFRIILAVLVVHAALFVLFGQMRALPKTRYIPPPNFGYKEETYENPKTGERTVWREIRVTTKLANREKLAERENAQAAESEPETN